MEVLSQKDILPRSKRLTSVIEAMEVLENLPFVKGDEKNGIIYYHKIGPFLYEEKESFCFVSYPYTSKKPIDYEYAFYLFIFKDMDEIITSTAPLTPHELREIEKREGLYHIEPKEDMVKTEEQARTVLENSFFVKGIKSYKDKNLVYYFKIGDLYKEYPMAFSFFGYPYTSLNPVINEQKTYLIYVDKWRGEVELDSEELTKKEFENGNKRRLSKRQEIGLFDWQPPDINSDIYTFDDDDSLFK